MNKILLGVAAGVVALAAVLVFTLPAQSPGSVPEELREAVAPQSGEVAVAPLADGRYFGYVSFPAGGEAGSRVVVDFAHWLSGEEAVEAATREYGCATASPSGPCEEGRGSVPNGFFISNPDPWVVREFDVAADAAITRVEMGEASGGVREGVPSTLAELAAHAAPFREGPPEVLAHVTVAGGKVVAVDEVYTP